MFEYLSKQQCQKKNLLRLSLACHFVLRKLYTEPSMNLSTKFQLIWPNGFSEDFFLLANHEQELPIVAILFI